MLQQCVQESILNAKIYHRSLLYSFRFLSLFSHMRTSHSNRYRFVELYYRRKSRNDAVKTQTVVIFLPDVRSCVPTRTEWDELDARYKAHFEMCVKKCGDDSDHKHGNVDVAEAGSADTIDDSSLNEDIGSDQPKPMNNEAKMKPADDEKTTTENEKALHCYCYILLISPLLPTFSLSRWVLYFSSQIANFIFKLTFSSRDEFSRSHDQKFNSFSCLQITRLQSIHS